MGRLSAYVMQHASRLAEGVAGYVEAYGYCHKLRTLQEIASYLGFSDRYRMKRVYIDPILGDLLEMTFAENKNNPAQKYVVKK